MMLECNLNLVGRLLCLQTPALVNLRTAQHCGVAQGLPLSSWASVGWSEPENTHVIGPEKTTLIAHRCNMNNGG